jgi:O-phospho-L-seryl-tRNASec:L-selenocysteinyl-tRNA synthase
MEFTKSTEQFVGAGYAKVASDSLKSTENQIQSLLAHRAMPQHGWSDLTIKFLLDRIALMDSNNFDGNCGVGEREGRVFSKLV